MSSNTILKNHITIENLRAELVEGGTGLPLMFALRGFSASITQDGLSKLVAALIPQELLKVRIVDHPGVAGCTIQIQASRMGFTPRITVSIVPANTVAGAILINVDPANRWSPLDRVLLGIAHHNLDKIAVKQPGITRVRTGVYQIDLRGRFAICCLTTARLCAGTLDWMRSMDRPSVFGWSSFRSWMATRSAQGQCPDNRGNATPPQVQIRRLVHEV
jgi:hypothetical protein